MEKLIYFPGFEIQNLNWLKYALLYIEELRPIIPFEADGDLSNQFKEILNSTNLLTPYRPCYKEGKIASAQAIERISFFQENPLQYQAAFHKYGMHYTENDIISEWRNTTFQTCTLYSEKFTCDFEQYCIENGFATKCEKGIRVSKEFAFIYMSLLADYISFMSDAQTITDHTQYNTYLLMDRKNEAKELNEKISFCQKTIDMKLPTGIEHIPLSEIIKLRSKPKYMSALNAFNKCTTQAFDNFDNTIEREKALSELLSIRSECCSLFSNLAVAAVGISLTAYNVSQLSNGLQMDMQSLTAVSPSIGAFDALGDIRKNIKTIRSKHMPRKFVANLRNLNLKTM